MKRIAQIPEANVYPTVKCPATGKLTTRCWNCKVYRGSYKNGDIKCAYPYDKPLPVIVYALEKKRPRRLKPSTYIKLPDTAIGHPALAEDSQVFHAEHGTHWETFIKDRKKLYIR
jgi:hypothetical protein